ncbi:MAG TPA: hypothetical protein VEX88_10540 [Glaciibacter sp.]|nr:hypothetical protein [Glaciibacter sp.]
MVLLIVCSVLFVAGLVMIAVWGGHDLRSPASEGEAQAAGGASVPLRTRVSRTLCCYAWWATVITVASVASGILIAGAGGRLVMRVIALTSQDAVGRLTEGGARVGVISLDGTFGLFVFSLATGFLSAVLYALIHTWLPRGRLGGVLFGVILLLLFSTIFEPLRADNVDFDIVGPGWLSVLLFSSLVILHGMLVAAVAGWYSKRLLLRPDSPWRAYSPLIAAVLYLPMGVALAAGAVVALIGAILVPVLARWWSSVGVRWAGRAALVLLVILAVPGFAGSIVSIVER